MARALREYALTCVAKGVSVNLNSATKQTLYTVPTGKTFVAVKVVLRGASATAATGVVTVGGDATPSDFIAGVNLTNLTAAAQRMVEIVRIPNATPPTAVDYPAATVFGIKPSTLVAATCLADVFGYLY